MNAQAMTCEQARAELARLQALQAEQQAEHDGLQRELAALELQRGQVALAALDGGPVKAVSAIVAKVADVKGKLETTAAMLAALDIRLTEAREGQRSAVVAELRRRAAGLVAEVEARKAKRAELYRLFADFDGEACVVLNPERSKTEAMQRRAEAMQNAADQFVARGLDCPRDPATGCAFDDGLW